MGDAAEIEQGGAVRMLKDLFAGAAGGIAQVLIGMVFLFGIVFYCVSFLGCCSLRSRALLPCLLFYLLRCFILLEESRSAIPVRKIARAMMPCVLQVSFINILTMARSTL